MAIHIPKNHLKFSCLLTGIVFLFYLGYIVINESREIHLAKNDTQHYGELLSGYLWDIDEETAQEYTMLITVEGNFKSLNITHDDGSPFASYQHDAYHGEIRSFLKSVGLIRDIHSSTAIQYRNQTIGEITTVRENTKIYTYFYVLLTLLLGIALITLLRIGRASRAHQQNLEHDLSENLERLQTVVSTSPVITFSINKQAVFTFCEGMGLNKLHEKPVDIIGKSIDDVLHQVPTNMNDFLRALRGESFSEVRMINGRSFETWYSPVRDGEQIKGVTGVATDVTAAIQAINSLDEYKRRCNREHALAQQSHKAFLPSDLPKLTGYEIGFVSKPSDSIGGDYLQFSESDDHMRLGITFAEMSGHGVSSSLLASIFHTQLEQSLSHETASIADAFYKMNAGIHDLFPEGRFASTFYTIIDSNKHELRYVKASREPAILYRKDKAPLVMDKGGPALGLLPSDLLNNKSYQESTLELNVGDTLLLYSDGVVEVENAASKLIDRKDIIEWVEEEIHLNPQELTNSIHRRVISHAAGRDLLDDISILVIRRSNKSNDE